jgi:DNA-binding transcriptional regulator YiaG
MEPSMPNIASVFKEEIMRLARKELRSEAEGLKKASAQYRSDIAALKRRVATLEKEVSSLDKKTKSAAPPAPAEDETTRVRFSPKGLAKLRQRLGLSAADLGLLLEVSAQTVYNWETEKTRPRAQQLLAIARVRSMGKRQVKARLGELAAQ